MKKINTAVLEGIVKQLASLDPELSKDAVYELCKTFLRMKVHNAAEYESAIRFIADKLEL